jgi:hypothetical protein
MYAEDGSRQRKPGVYTLRSKDVLSLEALDRLYETRYLFSHSAGKCRDIGDAHKAEVWEVLVHIVEGRLGGASGPKRNGSWNQNVGAALAL